MTKLRQLPCLLRYARFSATSQQRLKVTSASSTDTGNVKPFEDIPGPRGIHNIPFIGAMFHFKPFTNYTVESLHNFFNNLLAKYGPLVRVRLRHWTVLVEDVRDIEKVLRHEGKYPERPLPLIHVWYCEKYGELKGIGARRGEEWHKFRSPVNPRMMRPKSAQHYLSIQNEVADDLVTYMRKSRLSPEETQELFFRYACESMSAVVFNDRLGYMGDQAADDKEKMQVLKDIQKLFEIMNNTVAIPPFILMNFPMKMKREYKEAADRAIRFGKKHYEKLVDDIKKRSHDGSVDAKNNFVYSLMLSDKLSVDDMCALALDMFGAGTDSTARNIQIFLYNLARNPDKQQKLYEEIVNVIGKHGPLTEEAMPQMKYLIACVKESFRLNYPTVAGMQRFLPEDIVLQGYKIPAGTAVALMNQKTVKDERYFPDPEAFDPDRWLRDEDGNRSNPIPPLALLPFGFGPRQCIGKRFAEQEIYLAGVKIIQNFQVALEPGHEEVEILYRIFVGPKHPIRFTFEERT